MNAWLRRLGLLGILLILPFGVLVTDAHGTLQRYAEAIVVSGGELAPLAGATAGELKVYLLHHDAWQPVLAQMDERDANDNFVAKEDSTLDDNDQLVFLLGDTGEQRPAESWPPGLSKDYPAVEVQIADPLDEDYEAYAYIFRGTGGEAPSDASRISYDAQTGEIRTRSYTLGFARGTIDNFVGYKRLSLYTDQDNLLDRLKIRATISTLLGERTVNEQDLAGIMSSVGGSSVDPAIVGPVRLVLDAAGQRLAYPDRVTLSVRLPSNLTGPGGVPLEVKDVRVSLDFSPQAVPATYRDANVPAGVPIDGQPDGVPEGPIPAWREIEFEAGRAVVLTEPKPGATTAKVYFKDNSAADADDTGDGKSYGDNGIVATKLEDYSATGFPGEMVVLPIGRQLTAQQLSENLGHPLVVTVNAGPVAPTPTAGAGTALPSPATPTSSPVEPTPTGRPTGGAQRNWIYAPVALKGFVLGQ